VGLALTLTLTYNGSKWSFLKVNVIMLTSRTTPRFVTRTHRSRGAPGGGGHGVHSVCAYWNKLSRRSAGRYERIPSVGQATNKNFVAGKGCDYLSQNVCNTIDDILPNWRSSRSIPL
jgi:hypothetical protein